MAVNDMIVRILGDSRSVERAFARSSNAATQFNRNVETTGRKLDSNAKKFSGFAKGAAAGFGGAVAFNAAINGIRSVALAAAESQQVLGQTRVALESTGKSWERYGETIQDTVKAQSRLGFDDEALLRTFSQFQRTTGDVGEALRLNNLAMDVARARFIDLEQAASLVTKAAIGNAGALRRLGINAKVGSSSVELLTLLTEKYGGAAEAASEDSSTSFARTQVAVENLQESVGTLLLPALEKLAEAADTAAQFATNLSDALGALGRIRIPEIVLPFRIKINEQTLGDIVGGALGKLKFTPLNPLLGFTIANAIADQFRDQTRAAAPGLGHRFATDIGVMTFEAMRQASAGAAKPPAFGQKGFKPLPENTLGDELEAAFEAQLDALSLKFDKAEAQRGIQNDLQVLAEMRRVIEARIATQGRTTDLQRLLFQNDQQRRAVIAGDAAAAAAARARTAGILAKDAADRQQRAREEAELARKTAQALRDQKQARQFRALGLAASGEEIVPGIKNLQTRIAGALRRISSGDLDVSSKLVDRLKLARKLIRAEGGKLTEDTRRAIDSLIKTIAQGQDKLDKQAGEGPLTATSSLRANKLLEGLGLGADAERELRARLSSFNSAGLSLAGTRGPSGNFRGGVPVVQSNVTVELDGEVIGRVTRRSDQKNVRRNPTQKRGSRRGGV